MKETDLVNSYIWKNLECEICKSSYSDTTKLKSGEIVSLLNYNVHSASTMYMIIESVTNTTSKTIHVINFNQRNKIKVGRGQNAEVRITDISVSRFHSLIRLSKKGEVFIEDNQSKFGTLMELNHPMQIKYHVPIYIQVGRTVLVLFCTNRYSCIERCFCMFGTHKKKGNEIYYNEAMKYFPYEFQMLFKKLPPLIQNENHAPTTRQNLNTSSQSLDHNYSHLDQVSRSNTVRQ